MKISRYTLLNSTHTHTHTHIPTHTQTHTHTHTCTQTDYVTSDLSDPKIRRRSYTYTSKQTSQRPPPPKRQISATTDSIVERPLRPPPVRINEPEPIVEKKTTRYVFAVVLQGGKKDLHVVGILNLVLMLLPTELPELLALEWKVVKYITHRHKALNVDLKD